MRNTVKLPAHQNLAPESNSKKGTPNSPATGLKSRSSRKRKHFAELPSQEQDSLNPKAKKAKLAGTTEPQHEPLRPKDSSDLRNPQGQSQPLVRSRVRTNGRKHVSNKSSELLDHRVRLGGGPLYKYESLKFFDLYKSKSHLYGGDEANSTVFCVKRLRDDFSFVAKMIDRDHSKMADRELESFNILGHHPNITQFVEAFYDKRKGTHYIVLEAAQEDLDAYVSRMGPHRHRSIIDQAPQIIAQAANAIAYVHSHHIAHRDIKPENILMSITELGHINVRLSDFGCARVKPQPTSEKKWRAGSPDWMAPASFMMHPRDDRLVDCYGIGRILYFLLSSSPWPKESRNPDAKCRCHEACPSVCVKRTLAFNTLMNAGMGDACVNFLQNLLVGDPSECMDIGEILAHAYLTNAVSQLTN